MMLREWARSSPSAGLTPVEINTKAGEVMAGKTGNDQLDAYVERSIENSTHGARQESSARDYYPVGRKAGTLTAPRLIT